MKKSVIVNWTASYLSIIAIALAVMLVLYSTAKTTIQEEVANSNHLVLEKVRDNVDNILNNVETFTAGLSSLEGVKDLLEPVRPSGPKLRYYELTAVNMLDKFVALNGIMENMYIYVDYADVVLTPGIVYKAKNYFNMYLCQEDYSYEQWKSDMQTVYQGEYRKMLYQDEIFGRQEKMSFIRSIPLNSGSLAAANVVIFLDFDYFLSLGSASEDGLEQKEILLMDTDNHFIYGDERLAQGIRYEDLAEGTGSITTTVNGNKIVISSAESAVNGWRYMIVTPERVFWEKLDFLRKVMICGIFLGLLLELLLSFLLIRRNYRPLNELTSYLKNRLRPDMCAHNDEYAFVKQSLLEMLEKTETYSEKLEKQSAFMREKFIVDLMKDKSAVIPTEEVIETYGLSFPYAFFAVMLINIENIDENFWYEGYEERELDVNELVKLVISNVVEELINREMRGYIYFSEEKFLCLINTPLRDEKFHRKMLDITKEAANFIYANFKIRLKFSFGEVFDRLEDTSVSYTQAVHAMEYSQSAMMDETVFYDCISMEQLRSYYRIRDTVYRLVEENYADQNLCINFIAEKIGNHPNYISKMFKEQTGVGVGEYINRFRIDKAKELLVQGKLTPKEIAEKTGYSNVRTFYRAFKKITGDTPGNYK